MELAEPAVVRELTHAQVGFAGPIGLEIPVYADLEVMEMKNFIIGANETGFHYKNVNVNRDFTPDFVRDIRVITDGDVCPKCGAPIKTAQGIEVGHIFKLGTKYSEALGLRFQDEKGSDNIVLMGCYGIGVTRCISAAIEQNYDDNGIIMPVAIAPFEAAVVPVNVKDGAQRALAEELYGELRARGIDVVIDDRDERAGVKFKDMDLIGIPARIVVGKKAADGVVEFKRRTDEKSTDMPTADAIEALCSFIAENK